MPLIAIDHSPGLDLDHDAFAKELHELVADTLGVQVTSVKSVFRPAAHHRVGDGATDRELLLMEVKILTGRPAELQTALTDRITALLESRLTGPVYAAVQLTELARETFRSITT
ncbi:hypothetical protein [Kitasatospora viridis]|uniref:5-carboxymethyl-2-hydroxymuconate isomerase n=1 Tax=Kitasatospora viridis TaxID=281105 RepID=A0A561UPQ6_9ACTN|nr:hypothetical protein [Kitasatospora viridis]TWG01340.1 5-carboxymethyl-2-hydroxymuconate isomerase [Kitasatospora viridis]